MAKPRTSVGFEYDWLASDGADYAALFSALASDADLHGRP
jgi:hypothetical protein